MKVIQTGWYYFQSIFRMLFNIKNWPMLVPLFLQRSISGTQWVNLRRPPLRILVRGAMDVWSVKETFLDRFYTRYGVPFENGWQVVDIGAGVGDFSIFAAYGNPDSRVIAYEPYPESYRLMIKNLTVNAIDNVLAFQEALWREDGELWLDVSNDEPLEIVSNASPPQTQDPGTFKVQGISLENALRTQEIRKLDLLKLDCEGAEYEILLNTSLEVMSKIERIIMEYHDLDADKNHRKLVLFMKDAGFQVSTYENQVHDDIGYLFATRVGK